MIRLLLAILCLTCGLAGAQEVNPSPPSQSIAKTFWITGQVGYAMGARSLLADTGGTAGYPLELNIRYQFNEYLGLMAVWNRIEMDYYSRHSGGDIRDTMYGLGVTFKFDRTGFEMGTGSYLMGHLNWLYGKTEYNLYDWKQDNREFAAGSSSGWGLDGGADVFIPLRSGFWAHYGAGLRSYQFDYGSVPLDSNGDSEMVSHVFVFVRVGLSYAF